MKPYAISINCNFRYRSCSFLVRLRCANLFVNYNNTWLSAIFRIISAQSTEMPDSKTDPTPSIISSLVEKLQSEGLEVVDHQLERNAVSLGHNFCSGIAKLKVHLKRSPDGPLEEKSFVLKIPILSPFYDQLSALKMYQNEVLMYSQVLPAMSALSDCNLTADSYLPPDSDNLVLDDLNKSGYIVMDKKNQLDLAHSKLCVIALAKLHALSIKLHQVSKEIIDVITVPPRKTPEDTTPSAIFEKFDNTVAVLGLPEEIRLKVHHFVRNYTEITFNDTMLPNENFNVLCHGDFWLGNVLFKHNGEDVEDVKMVDFQMVHWCSPAIDLIEFFVTSVQFDVYSANRDVLIELYLENFNKLLDSLNSTVRYSRSELERDLRRYKQFHLYCLGPYMSAVLSDQEDPFNLSGKDNIVYTSPLYKDALLKWIQYLNDEDML